MALNEEEEYSVGEITREHLDRALEKLSDDIKEHLDLKIEPMEKEIDVHSRTLYGKSGSNGISGTVTVLKWGYGLLVIGLIFMAKKFFA